ncbi:MAG: type I DNA topoisomerase [Bacteroidia bacterium]|nr:type I DNA topoisomerase [Bacteroidia bacterium]
MSKNLVIVESPAKAKTIEKFLGKDYTVKSSYGHVRDLAKTDMGIDIKNNFEPVYIVSEDKKKVIAELKKDSAKAKIVWLATDEDREGEAISWHLAEALNLKKANTKRIVFHEITKKAILEAIENPRTIDKNLVDAQQARRVLDRLVGFELSPVLWKKIKPQLSAGRVQSVAVRLIVEREREIISFVVTPFYKVTGVFNVKVDKKEQQSFKADFQKRFSTEVEANELLTQLIGAEYFVKSIEKKPGKRSPAPPFTTSTLQQEAGRKLGYGVTQTMVIAQKLYEAGHITYMRTDSVNLSQEALKMAKNVIVKNYGEKYSEPHQYKTKQASAQEAHEAIRPTDMFAEEIDGDDRDQRLYDLIRKRTLASQMADAEIEKTIIEVVAQKNGETIIFILHVNDKNNVPSVEKQNVPAEFVATGEVILFDGFLRVYFESTDDDDDELKEGVLPAMTVNQKLAEEEINAVERFTSPPPRYREAPLVKKLEELGIGRPSTYAPTISTVQKRGYVIKESREGKERKYKYLVLKDGEINTQIKTEITGAEKNKLFPTDIGIVVNDFLLKNFPQILDFQFTAKVEEEFDVIAEGKMEWHKMIKDFYKPFHKTVETTLKESERASGERILGKDPASGNTLLVRVGRFGPMAQIGTTEETEKPRYAKLRSGQLLENITLEEALDLFLLPRNLGEFEGSDITVSIGRFGPYAKHGNLFASLKKEDDPYTVTRERAIELILEKQKAAAERIIKEFKEEPEIKILKGRWGPFIKFKEKNLRIPKNIEPEKLTLEEIFELEKKAPAPQKKAAWAKRGKTKK